MTYRYSSQYKTGTGHNETLHIAHYLQHLHTTQSTHKCRVLDFVLTQNQWLASRDKTTPHEGDLTVVSEGSTVTQQDPV